MRKVLVVEDDKFISAILAMFLRELGHELIGKCAEGADAVDLCHRLRPDVVLMDIHLEGEMDGIQTAEQLRRELDIPVIYVSSDTTSQVIKRAIVSNSYGFLVKPVNKKELGISIDLAYYKHKVDQEQRERERGYRQFISEVSMPLMIVQNGNIHYLNNLALDLFKTHYMEDVLMLPYLNFIEEDDKKTVQDLITDFNSSGKGFECKKIAMKDVHGQSFFAKISGSSVVFNKKKSLQITLHEYSEAVYAQKRNDEFVSLLNELHAPFVITDNRFIIKSHSSIPAFDAANLVGKSIQEMTELFDLSSDDQNLTCLKSDTKKKLSRRDIKDGSGSPYEYLFC